MVEKDMDRCQLWFKTNMGYTQIHAHIDEKHDLQQHWMLDVPPFLKRSVVYLEAIAHTVMPLQFEVCL